MQSKEIIPNIQANIHPLNSIIKTDELFRHKLHYKLHKEVDKSAAIFPALQKW